MSSLSRQGWRSPAIAGIGSASIRSSGPILPCRAAKGKEDPARRRERYGYASAPRPQGPLVWFHAASVGETNAVIPLIKEIRRRGINVVLTTGTTTSARVAAERSGRGGHSPICAARFQAGGQPFPRILAAGSGHHRRIGNLADDHHRTRPTPYSAGSGQWPPVRPHLRPLEASAGARRCAVREPRARHRAVGCRRRAFPHARCAAGDGLRQPQGRHRRAAARPAGDLHEYRQQIGARKTWAAISTFDGEENAAGDRSSVR